MRIRNRSLFGPGRASWLLLSGLGYALLVAVAGGKDWYVDPGASGARTGRTWADAWVSPREISWVMVGPGDTLFLSGSPEGLRYPNALVVSRSGTAEQPITIRVGRDPGHHGRVILPMIDLEGSQWVVVDGALSDAFSPPANVRELRQMTNNIGIFCSTTNGSAIYMTAPVGVQLRWLGVERAERGGKSEAHGIRANVVRRGATDKNQVRYCWIQNTDDDGISWIGNLPATHFGHQEVAFSIIERVGDDGLEANHGFDVHDCILGPSRFLNGHPDGVQSVGSYWRIYNNEFHDFFNSWLRMQATQTNHHDIWIYNNLFLSGRYGNPKVFIYNTGIELVQYADALGEKPEMVWSRLYVCNNTFYNAGRLAGGVINLAKRDEKTKAAFVHNVIVTNSAFMNNVVVECARGAAAWRQELRTAPPWGTSVHYSDPTSLRWDYNTVTGTHAPDASRIGYMGVLYPSGEAMARTSPWRHNSAVAVKFANPLQWDFELAPDDVAARGTGTNLHELFTIDLLNRPRGSTWDRGAFQSSR